MDCKNFVQAFEESIYENWDSIAMTDYEGIEVSYGVLYGLVRTIGSDWKERGILPGKRIAIFAPNSTKWLVLYLAIIMNGYVAVLLPDNLSQDIAVKLLSNSGCHILYSSIEHVPFFQNNNFGVKIREIESIPFSLECKDETKEYLSKNSRYDLIAPDDNSVCTILYTSGSMGAPKGSMISYKNLSYEVAIVSNWMRKYQEGQCQVNFLPYTHIFGLICDALTPLYMGMQLVILGMHTSLVKMLDAFRKYKPCIFFAVPVVVDNLVKMIEGSSHNSESYAEGDRYSELRKDVLAAFGGRLNVIITGGTPMSSELEQRLIYNLNLPFVTGYGITECGPLSAGIVGSYQEGSCGKILDRKVIRIKKRYDTDISGEVQVKGNNTFAGYFKNERATSLAFTSDGWFKTGDLGFIDNEENLFITGRCKDMLLTSNGENIYPEEAEEAMNSSTYIRESVLAQRGEKLHAIVVPDRELARADGLDEEALTKKIDDAVREAGTKLPGFTIINSFELRDQPLERTPKGSLKRYLYSDGIKES